MPAQPDDKSTKIEVADTSELDEEALNAAWENLKLPEAKPWSESDRDVE